jgi:hypothetical protein
VDAEGNYLGGFSEGNIAIPSGAVEIIEPPESATDKMINGVWEKQVNIQDYDIAIEKHLDAEAEAAGYYDPLGRIPNIDRACAYAGFENDYQAESQSFIAWRASVWSHVYNVKSDVEAGNRIQPSIEELIAELPKR